MNTLTPAECRAARNALGWTKRALADAAGVNVWSVSKFENHTIGRQDRLIPKLREALLDGGALVLRENGFSVIKFRVEGNAA